MERGKNIVEKINHKNIYQKPKWYFRSLKGLIWIGFSFTILLGAVSFSIILFAVQQVDFHLWKHLRHSSLELLLGLIPLLWIVILSVNLFFSTLILRNLPRGYKYLHRSLLGFSTILSIILGSIFYFMDGADELEQVFAKSVISYERIEQKKIKIWSQQEKGFLSGRIIEVKTDTLLLNDFKEVTWIVPFKHAYLADNISLIPESTIKIIGISCGNKLFIPKEIHSWARL